MCDCFPHCLSSPERAVREADNYLLEDSLALEMGGRQEMEMDKFHAPTEEGPGVQNI